MVAQTSIIEKAEESTSSPFGKRSLSDAEFAARLADLKRRKDDPEHKAYVRRLMEGAEEARRQIDEEVRRQMDEEAGK